MAEGKLRIGHSLLADDSVLGARCYFRRDGGGDETVVFHWPTALLCEDCGTVVIRGQFSD
jgi:hypothetical protein